MFRFCHFSDDLNLIIILSMEFSAKVINDEDEINAIDEMELGLDFDDALQVSAARALNAEIISFDKHFNNVEGIQRLTPSDVVYTGNDQ